MEENKETKKLSYEQLENVANQLSIQLQRAKQQIGQMTSVLNKIPYLFKVVEFNKMFSDVVVKKSIKEIEDILYPKITDEEA